MKIVEGLLCFTTICNSCSAKHIHTGVEPKILMRDFTEDYKTRIFNRKVFENWFEERFGSAGEEMQTIIECILTSEGVEFIEGVVNLYKSPHSISRINRQDGF